MDRLEIHLRGGVEDYMDFIDFKIKADRKVVAKGKIVNDDNYGYSEETTELFSLIIDQLHKFAISSGLEREFETALKSYVKSLRRRR